MTLPKANLWGEDIPWLYGLREKGAQAFSRIGMPNNKTEAWKYSYSRLTDVADWKVNKAESQCHGNCHCHEHENSENAGGYVIKFCNGKLHIEESLLPKGLTIKPLIEAIYDDELKSYVNKTFDLEQFPFAALNTAYLEQGVFIYIERETKIEQPILLQYHQHEGNNYLQNIRNIVVLERGAKAKIIENFSGESANANYFNNVVNEMFVGNDAELQYYKKINESKKAQHISLNSVMVRKNGIFKGFCAVNECELARHESFICLQQEGATAEMNGIYRLNNDGCSDITTNIRHLAPHTFSNQLVKGVVDASAQGIFQGQIHIAPEAQQCEGYQLHKALLLSDTAEVSCKPELEIYADDVKCSHGATSGDLDEEQLFYLQSRGINESEARQILIDAYLKEVTDKIPDEAIKEMLQIGICS